MTFFGFPKVKWLHLRGEVDKSVKCSCQVFLGFNIPKIIKMGQFLTELFKKNKTLDVFWGRRVVMRLYCAFLDFVIVLLLKFLIDIDIDIVIRVARKKCPKLLHGVLQQSR